MQLKISTFRDTGFIYTYIPRVLKGLFRREYNTGRLMGMENYLEKINLGYNIIEVFDAVVDNMSITNYDTSTTYRLDTNKQFEDTPYTMSQLVGLIENGNLEVKGTQAIRLIINMVSYNQDYYLHKYILSRRS